MKKITLVLGLFIIVAAFPLNAKDKPKLEDFPLSARVVDVSNSGSLAEAVLLWNFKARTCGLRIEDTIYTVDCEGMVSSTQLTLGKVFPARFKNEKRTQIELLVTDKKGKQVSIKYKVNGVREAKDNK